MSPKITRKQILPILRDARLDGRTRDATLIAAELPPRIWHHERHEKDPDAIVVGESGSWARQTVMINPTMRKQHEHCYVLHFGAYGWTRLHCYAMSLEDAIEDCAAWLASYAPGHIMEEWGERHTSLVKEACEDAGLTYPPPADLDDLDEYYEAQTEVEADLTRTESGFLTSYEWGIALEDPSVEEFYAFVCGE